MSKIFLFISLLAFMSGCTSKVDEIIDEKTKEERSLKAAEEAQERAPKVDLLENTTLGEQKICISTNQIKILVTENDAQPIKCFDQTKLSDQYKIGPVCPGGVDIKNISSSTAAMSCSDLTICGVKPVKAVPLSTGDPAVRMTQLIYEKIPWGCTGKIKVDGGANAALKAEIAIDVKPPPCEYCADKGISTCESCGNDKILPKFTDVVIDKSKCRTFNVLIFAEDAESGLHREPYSFDGGKTWTDSNKLLIDGRNLNLPTETLWIRDRAGNIAKYAKAITDIAMLCGCTTPWGETIVHGASKAAYKVNQVECEQTCTNQTITRTCNDGVLSGDDTYRYASCMVKECPGCTTPWGDMVRHQDTIATYKQSDVSCQDQCESKVATCTKGVWSQSLAGFAQKACKATYAKCDCDHKGRVVKNGENLKVYTKDSYACSEPPMQGEVKCNLGVLSGNTDYNYVSYSVKPCKCLTAWGQMLDKDQIVDAYKKSEVTCMDNYACGDTANRIRVKCVDHLNNTMQIIEGIGPISAYTKPTCTFKPCKCRHLNVEFGPNDPPLSVYRMNSATHPNRCDLNGNKGTVKCTADITLTGDTSTAAFPYTQCVDSSGNGTGTGDSDYDNGLGAGGGSGGGVGNSQGDGEGFKRRRKGGGGGGCNPDNAPYYCPAATLSLNIGISDQFCLLPGPDGYALTNTESTNYKQRIQAGGWIAAYSKKEVTKPDSCSKYMGIIRCNDGKMSGAQTYKYLNCTEKD